MYRELGATNDQIKRFVEMSLPVGIQGIEWLTDIYMKSARVGFSEDKGKKYSDPVYNLLKTGMKANVEKWNNGEFRTFRKI